MKSGALLSAILALVLLVAAPGRAGRFAGIEPGRSTKEDVRTILGEPLATTSDAERLDYDGTRYQAKVISVKYSPQDSVVDDIDIYPAPETFKKDYQRWFGLAAPTSTERDERGNLVEYYFPQAVALHYQGSTDAGPIVYFTHLPFEERGLEEILWSEEETQEPSLIPFPVSVQPGEMITLKFAGAPGNTQDWVALYPIDSPSEDYRERYFLEGKTEGELSFTAPHDEGDYEFRLFANWPEGGYQVIAASEVISIGTGPLVSGSDKELLEAAGDGDLDKVQEALGAGANVNAKDENGWTPLLRASGQGHIDVVRALIQAGADLDWQARTGQSALNVAAFAGHTEIVRTLIQAGADVNAQSKNAQFNYFEGATPLFMASRTGKTDIVRILLQSGAKVDARNTSGDTPLFLAALSGYSETVRTLIQAGADVEARSNQGATPLMCAAESGQLEVLWLLVDAGADVNTKITGDVPSPYAGATALMVAAHQGHPTIVAALVTARANVRATNSEGQTALMLTSQEDHPRIAEILREPGRSPQAARRILSQDLMKAVDRGALQIAKVLIWFGADVNARDDEGSPVLMRAVQAGLIDIVRSLLDQGADVNQQGRYGETPLLVAAAEGQTDIVEMLIRSGAGVNRKAVGDEEDEGAGWTALMVAAMGDHEEVVRQLLAAGADPEATNDAGETALDIARSRDSMKALRLLEVASLEPTRDAGMGETPEGRGMEQHLSALDDGLVAYYSFDGDANDRSGRKNHATVHGATLTGDRFGNANSAYRFDGINDYVDTPVQENLPQTVAAWVKPDSSLESAFMTVLDSDRCSDYGQGIEISYPGKNPHHFQVDTHNSFYDTEKSVEWDVWQHVVAVYTSGNVKFYHNGILIHSQDYSQGTLDGRAYTIGNHCRSGTGQLRGVIDDVHIYERALSESEVQKLYDLGGASPVRAGVTPSTPPTSYDDAFRLSSGELIIGEFLSFDGRMFKIRTKTGVIEKKREEIVAVWLGVAP